MTKSKREEFARQKNKFGWFGIAFMALAAGFFKAYGNAEAKEKIMAEVEKQQFENQTVVQIDGQTVDIKDV